MVTQGPGARDQRPDWGLGARGPGPGDEFSPAPSDPRPPTHDPGASPWRLARGVSLLEGTLVGGEPPGTHVYALVLPTGRRLQVSEALYRLVELLQSRLPPEEIAARLAARLGRSLSAQDVATLVATRLRPQGVVSDPETMLEQ
jgi:hypothetical protein